MSLLEATRPETPERDLLEGFVFLEADVLAAGTSSQRPLFSSNRSIFIFVPLFRLTGRDCEHGGVATLFSSTLHCFRRRDVSSASLVTRPTFSSRTADTFCPGVQFVWSSVIVWGNGKDSFSKSDVHGSTSFKMLACGCVWSVSVLCAEGSLTAEMMQAPIKESSAKRRNIRKKILIWIIFQKTICYAIWILQANKQSKCYYSPNEYYFPAPE